MRNIAIRRLLAGPWKDIYLVLPQIYALDSLSQPSNDQTPYTQFMILLGGIHFR